MQYLFNSRNIFISNKLIIHTYRIKFKEMVKGLVSFLVIIETLVV